MRANDLVVKLEYIKVGSLKQIQKNGALSFFIPGFSKKIKAKATYVEYANDDNYKWYGKTEDELGDIIFLSSNGGITGYISIPEGVLKSIQHLMAIICL